ncbi:MAG: pilus assembly PilX N-terminal domain-containing protein [candidate division WOR-3 bacterium]
MSKEKEKKGIALIVVLWIITILTVVVAATSLMTYSDIASAINLKKRYRTLKAAEVPGDFVISYLPEYKKLHELDTLFFEIDYNKVFYENNNGDTVYSIPLFLSGDSSISGCLALPYFIDFNKDSSLIVSASTVGPNGVTDTNWVNPIFTHDGAVIYYRTRGVIEQSSDIVAYRRIRNASSFNIPSGGAGFGHTMY